jgi:[ribosomal protein S18]-alanine N-acetyltransferase
VTGRCAVERATLEDVPALAALEAACFSHPWTAHQLSTEVALGPPGEVLIARGPGAGPGEGPAVGAYCAYRVVIDEMQVMNVAVDPGWRRRGVARFLLRLAMRRAARAGAQTALLDVRAGNLAALALYASLGFEPIGVRRGYYSAPPEDALVLRLSGLSSRP